MALATENRELAATPFEIRVAFHEAGHGVIAHVLDVPFRFVAVQPTPTSCGRLQFTKSVGDVEMEALTLIHLAGSVAEEYFLPDVRHDVVRLDGADRSNARILVHAMLTDAGGARICWPEDRDVDAACAQWNRRAAQLVQRHASWIGRIARELARWRRLSSNEVLHLKDRT